MAAISWTDTIGAAVLRSAYPAPGDRLQAWRAVYRDEADRQEALGTGAVHAFIYRTDIGVTCELRGITARPLGTLTTPTNASPLTLAIRLIRHLSNGGSCTVATGNPAGTTYTATKLPGAALADPQLTDATAGEFTLALALKFVGLTAPVPDPYVGAA